MKDFSKIYKIRSCSSMATIRPTDNVNVIIKEMFLFDDILKVKGHSKSVDHKNEKPYDVDERHELVMQLMDLNDNGTRVFKHRGIERTYRGILMEHEGTLKNIDIANFGEKRYKYIAQTFHRNRHQVFNNKLRALMQPTTGFTINDKIKYGNLIPKLTLFEGKAYINIFKKDEKGHVFACIKTLVNIATDEYKDKHVHIGIISDRALAKICERPLPNERLFDVVEEWKSVSYQVRDTKKRKDYTWWKYSDSEKQVRVIIDNCRY